MKYEVLVSETYSNTITVEAENEQEAEMLAELKYHEGGMKMFYDCVDTKYISTSK